MQIIIQEVPSNPRGESKKIENKNVKKSYVDAVLDDTKVHVHDVRKISDHVCTRYESLPAGLFERTAPRVCKCGYDFVTPPIWFLVVSRSILQLQMIIRNILSTHEM